MIRRILAVAGILVREPDRSTTPGKRRPVRSDPSSGELEALQGAAPHWLVMWCWYRREYAALARFGAEPTIIYDRDPRQLLRRCREIEFTAARGRHPAHGVRAHSRTPSGPEPAQTPYGRSPP